MNIYDVKNTDDLVKYLSKRISYHYNNGLIVFKMSHDVFYTLSVGGAYGPLGDEKLYLNQIQKRDVSFSLWLRNKKMLAMNTHATLPVTIEQNNGGFDILYRIKTSDGMVTGDINNSYIRKHITNLRMADTIKQVLNEKI